VRRPSLDDVFVALTGHQIREQGAGEGERLMASMRSGRGGFGPMRTGGGGAMRGRR